MNVGARLDLEMHRSLMKFSWSWMLWFTCIAFIQLPVLTGIKVRNIYKCHAWCSHVASWRMKAFFPLSIWIHVLSATIVSSIEWKRNRWESAKARLHFGFNLWGALSPIKLRQSPDETADGTGPYWHSPSPPNLSIKEIKSANISPTYSPYTTLVFFQYYHPIWGFFSHSRHNCILIVTYERVSHYKIIKDDDRLITMNKYDQW